MIIFSSAPGLIAKSKGWHPTFAPGKATRFTSDNQPKNRRSRKGIPNRSTVLKKWLTAKTKIINPITKDQERGTVEDEVVLALITKAVMGDVPAIREILDTMYGKLTDKQEQLGAEGGSLEVIIKHVEHHPEKE
jgi:hypothetical protein